jgi:hypothetical protein
MKLSGIRANNRRKAFEVRTRTREFVFPYAECEPRPRRGDWVADVWIDKELGREGFSYRLRSGAEGTVHVDHVLEYNRDPDYMGEQLLYRLSLEAQRRVKDSPLSTREIIRRLGTSPAQFYRLLDQTNYRKSVRQMLALFSVLDCEVDLVVRERRSG